MNQYVIYDCDGGADDAWALLLLLKADQFKRVKLLAVTCVHGNARAPPGQAAVNIYRILKAAGRLDIPIHYGAQTELIPPTSMEGIEFFHGNDGFGDVFPDVIDYKTVIKPEHAVEIIHDLVNKYPQQITIFGVGPLTNIALAMTMYGEKWYSKFKRLFIMGGNYQAVGNATSAAEFNFYLDPEAAHIVLAKAKCPVTIVPWEACIPPNFNVPVDWRFNVIGIIPNPVSDILNTVETAELIPKGYTNWAPCDAIPVAIFLFGEYVYPKYKDWNAVVDVNGWLTRGQMVVDHLRRDRENVRVIEKIDSEVFKQIILWAVNSPLARSAFLQNLVCE